MTDETKKIFNAPWQKSFQDWETYKEITIYDSKNQPVCLTRNKEMSNRIARLPELYDTLFEITIERCARCVATHANRGIQAPLGFDFFTGECPFETDKYYDGDPCVWRQRWKLLQKVRDGE